MIELILGRARRLLFGVPIQNYEKACAYKGFHPGEGTAKKRLKQVTHTVFAGYHAALQATRPDPLKQRLAGLADAERIGFLYEGVGMGLAFLDAIDPLRPIRS